MNADRQTGDRIAVPEESIRPHKPTYRYRLHGRRELRDIHMTKH